MELEFASAFGFQPQPQPQPQPQGTGHRAWGTAKTTETSAKNPETTVLSGDFRLLSLGDIRIIYYGIRYL